MTAMTFLAVLIGGVAVVLAFDWVRTQRIKKALAAGGPAPHQHTGSQASAGAGYANLAGQQGNDTGI